ncbi:MAG: NADAR family protein [Pseudobdellovibrio sp.]
MIQIEKIIRIIFTTLFSFFIGSCAVAQTTVSDSYPDDWWKPVPESQIASWEIPPQAANRTKGEVVLSKRNELGQFSNLSATAFVFEGLSYASVEGLWQSMKYPESTEDERAKDKSLTWVYSREQVMQLSGFEAKQAGDLANENMKKMGIKWITYKGKKFEYNGIGQNHHYEIIYAACVQKIEQNEKIKKLLISTASLKLMADHKQRLDTLPSYKYQEIYSKIRNELK